MTRPRQLWAFFGPSSVVASMDDRISPASGGDQHSDGAKDPGFATRTSKRGRQSDRDRALPKPLKWVVFALSGVFLLLGALFFFAPAPGAAFYGFSVRSPSALFYVRAIGLRDAALALYLFGLAWAGLRRALMIVALGTLIIPIGDMLLLASSGAGEPVHYVLHGASLICFAALAWRSSLPPRLR